MARENIDDIDIELLIGEVKNYPEIWNIAEENYHDRTKKRAAWINICQSLCSEEFDEKDDKEKNEICTKVIKKWRNIKDNYVKSLKKTKSGQAAESGKRYMYARQLSFLQTSGARTETQSSFGGNDEEEDLEGSEEQPERNPTQPNESEQAARYEQHSSKKHKRDVESALIDFMKAPILSSLVAAVPQPNADRSFFESIFPSISNFTEDQKLEFRCQILNIIKRIRMNSFPQNYRYPPNISPQTQSHSPHQHLTISITCLNLNPIHLPHNQHQRLPLPTTCLTPNLIDISHS